ncbi:MAG: NAD(P)/FAD-dependent oxidoreductase [Acidobacteriota bacterium]|nr:NAD(P)/FAD-dependent oxidoreductase [Acidobacteriota bacterium]
MNHETDVFVIGGGPAGLAAAIAARGRGFDVVVADGNEPPIDKPCGEGLMPDSVLALRQLGVEDFAKDGFAFSGIRFVDGDSSVAAKFPSQSGVGIRRTILHEKMMRRAADMGVKFRWKTPVIGLQDQGVKLASGEIVAARWIVGADGGNSRVRRWIGLNSQSGQGRRFASRGHYGVEPWSDCVEIYWGQHGQAYVTPVSQREVCAVVISQKPNWRLQEALSEFPELSRRLGQGTGMRPERGAVTMMHRLNRVYRGNVALIGDASGGVDAITGEGLNLSFRQAIALAEAIAKNNLAEYQSVHRRLALRPTFMARLILLLDGRGRLRKRTFRVLARNPELFARMTAIHVGETSPRHFAATGALLGWRFLEG